MKSQKVLDVFKEILRRAEMEWTVSVGENINELADIMICEEENSGRYLAIKGTPLFLTDEIRNILYKCGREKGDYCAQVVIELQADTRYILEFVNGKIKSAMNFKGELVTEDEKIKTNLMLYNKNSLERNVLEHILWTVQGFSEGHKEEIMNLELGEIDKRVWDYLKDNPEDQTLLIHYAYVALELFVMEDIDVFDIKAISTTIVRNGLEYEFIDYIRSQSSCSYDFEYEDYFLNIVTTAMRLMREARE